MPRYRAYILLSLATACLVSGTSASTGYDTHVPLFSAHALDKALEYGQRIVNEKNVIRNRLNMLMTQKDGLMTKLTNILFVTWPELIGKQISQFDDLEDIRAITKQILHLKGPLKGRLDGVVAAGKKLSSYVDVLWELIRRLVDDNREQSAILERARTLFDEAVEKLKEKLAAREQTELNAITDLRKDVRACRRLVNTRKCTSIQVHVDIDQHTAKGSEEEDIVPFNFFLGNVPTISCAVIGYELEVHVSKGHSYPYGGYGHAGGYGHGPTYARDPQSVAFSVDCKPFRRFIRVHAFDQSRGSNNKVKAVYVSAKLCSFGPMAR